MQEPPGRTPTRIALSFLSQATLAFAIGLWAFSCTVETVDQSRADNGTGSAKADQAHITAIEWANQFFLTQVYDARWNPAGLESDLDSNNCGPASFSMVMRSRGYFPPEWPAELSIDHARALMYPSYPDIDPATLPEGISASIEEGLIIVDDDTHPVYFDRLDDAPSIPEGLLRAGLTPIFGSNWAALDSLLAAGGAVIAYGHITESWRARFPGSYGSSEANAVPHFIALFPTASGENYIVCDPMHTDGAVVMTRGQLQSFFQSPVNVYETSIRLIGLDVDKARQVPPGL